MPDGVNPEQPGDYAWMPYALWDHKPPFFLGEGEWQMVDPTGGVGAIGRISREPDGIVDGPHHAWAIHEDGTVTFNPSLVMPSGWHGFLERGVWN